VGRDALIVSQMRRSQLFLDILRCCSMGQQTFQSVVVDQYIATFLQHFERYCGDRTPSGTVVPGASPRIAWQRDQHGAPCDWGVEYWLSKFMPWNCVERELASWLAGDFADFISDDTRLQLQVWARRLARSIRNTSDALGDASLPAATRTPSDTPYVVKLLRVLEDAVRVFPSSDISVAHLIDTPE